MSNNNFQQPSQNSSSQTSQSPKNPEFPQTPSISYLLNQTASTSLFPNRRPSTRFISSPSKKSSKSKNPVQIVLKKARELISQQCIDEAIVQIQRYLNQHDSSRINLSPSKIITSSGPGTENPTQLSLLYCLGNCLSSQKRYSEATQILLKIKAKSPSFNYNNVSLLLAICYQKQGQSQKALETISLIINQSRNEKDFKSILQLVFLKGKILKNLKRLEQSKFQFQRILKNQPKHQESIKMLVSIYNRQKKYQQAVNLIENSLQIFSNQEKFIRYLLQRKSQLHLLNQEYQSSFSTIETLQNTYKLKQSKLNFMKGKICLKIKRFQQSVIYFNQALSVHSSLHFVKLALSELIIYFLRQRDFYEASVYAKRSSHLLNQKHQIIDNLIFLAQGLILLMKKNYDEGLKNLSFINLESFNQVTEQKDQTFLRNLYFNAKGFSFFSIGRHSEALQNYLKMQVNEYDEEFFPCHYNIELTQGILSILRGNNEQQAIRCFEKAIEYLLRPEPYFYISVILTQKNIKYEASAQIFMKILSILESGLNVNQTAQMHFYRSLVFMFLGMNVEAIQDIDKAIEISEDNVVDHFYAKGLIYFLEENYEQAIAELQVALSIDQKYSKAILQKAKCQIHQGNNQQAYSDLQTYRQLQNNQKDQTVWELYFLLYERKFEDILQLDLDTFYEDLSSQAASCVEDIKNTCNFFLGRFQQSGASGKLILALIYETFQQLLKLINQALELKVSVGPITQIDLKLIKAYVLFRMQKFHQSIQTYDQIESLLHVNQKEMSPDEVQLRFLITKINVIFCLYSAKLMDECKDRLEGLIGQINQSDVLNELREIYAIIQNQQTQGDPSESDKIQPYIVNLLNEKQLINSFLPFQTVGELSFKLMIPFPILDVIQLKPNRQRMLQEYEIRRMQNRAQAPWIKRGQFGVLFTNQIRQYNNLHLNTEQTQQANSKNKLLQEMKLGSQVLLKLQNIKQKPEQSN